MSSSSPRVRASLFVTCLVDQLFPQVGESTVRVLRRLGVEVDFPQEQTCCGQPAYNAGFHREARSLAKRFLKIFQDCEYIVVPSGSCGAMARVFYPALFHDDPELRREFADLASRVYELSEFLVKVLGVADVGASHPCRITYHDSCHLRRELGVISEPRRLIRGVKGAELTEMEQAEVCCGFGGSFSVKYPDISGAMLQDKIRNIQKTKADVLVTSDAGCLMHMVGGLGRRGARIKAMHLAELLDKGAEG